MANLDLAFIQLFWDLMNRKTGELSKVDYTPQKSAFDLYEPIEQSFERSTPEAQGVSSDYIAGMLEELNNADHVMLHEITIIRHGHVIYEGSVDPYRTGIWHSTYSMCKSFTGMAIGLLIDEGKLSLDDYAVDFLIPSGITLPTILLARTKYASLTIRDLLIMSSGSSFNEVGAISGNNWVKGFFDASVKFAPGTKFEYNSMNSYILSAIVTKITGKTMMDYLKEKLFDRMGIKKVFWETSPEGYTKGGWGMFITQEDAAKLGLLYMNKGSWNGEQLISKEWVSEAVKTQIKTGKDDNPGYGYHLWTGNVEGSFMYNGMLGQNVYCYPSLDMILVVNSGNDEVFATGTMTAIIRKYLSASYHPSDVPLQENETAYNRLMSIKKHSENNGLNYRPIMYGGWNRKKSAGTLLREGRSEMDFIRKLDGNLYEMHSKGIGLFPLILQVTHNNFTHGISYLRFRMKAGVLYLEFTEGRDINSFPVGFAAGRHSAIRLNKEEYFVGCNGRIGRNEEGEPVLTLNIAFIEEATERQLKIVFHSEDDITLKWSETPGKYIIADTLEMITTGSGNVNPFVDKILDNVSPGLIRDAMKSAINPEVHATIVEKHYRKAAAFSASPKDCETDL